MKTLGNRPGHLAVTADALASTIPTERITV